MNKQTNEWMNEWNNKKEDGKKEYLLVGSLASFNSGKAPRGLLLCSNSGFVSDNQLHPAATGLFMYPFLYLMHKWALFTSNADLWHSAVEL